MATADIEPMRLQFQSMDADKTGYIHPSELKEALLKNGVGLDEEQISRIIVQVDVANNGKINYSEFLAATISVQSFMTEEKMWMIFKRFDVDNTDYISKENLKEAMKNLGRAITSNEIEEALSTHDLTKDGKISFDEFK
jgi:calcium-dependent protein kinase